MWIGLTREVPKPEGTWRWTVPGDNSFFFSNWDHGKGPFARSQTLASED